MKLVQLVNSAAAFRELSAIGKKPKAAHDIFMFVKNKVQPHLEAWGEFEKALNEKYGEPVGDNKVKISEDNIQKYSDERNEYLNAEIEVGELPFDMDGLIDILSVNDQTSVTESLLGGLEPFLKSA